MGVDITTSIYKDTELVLSSLRSSMFKNQQSKDLLWPTVSEASLQHVEKASGNK